MTTEQRRQMYEDIGDALVAYATSIITMNRNLGALAKTNDEWFGSGNRCQKNIIDPMHKIRDKALESVGEK